MECFFGVFFNKLIFFGKIQLCIIHCRVGLGVLLVCTLPSCNQAAAISPSPVWKGALEDGSFGVFHILTLLFNPPPPPNGRVVLRLCKNGLLK
jgi:hypothetical protein